MASCFVLSSPLPSSSNRPSLHCCRRISRSTPCASFSNPFPLPDPFLFPPISQSTLSLPVDYRPELVGSILWALALYLGFLPSTRFATVVHSRLASLFTLFLPAPTATLLSTSLHTLPFLLSGFAIDAVLRYWNASNAIVAISTGLFALFYAAILEAARLNLAARAETDADPRWSAFVTFANANLHPSGRCHFFDVRALIRNSTAPKLASLTDETIRRFIRAKYPNALRSPNGFYRGLSIRPTGSKASDPF